jgi:hypothetical protein
VRYQALHAYGYRSTSQKAFSLQFYLYVYTHSNMVNMEGYDHQIRNPSGYFLKMTLSLKFLFRHEESYLQYIKKRFTLEWVIMAHRWARDIALLFI